MIDFINRIIRALDQFISAHPGLLLAVTIVSLGLFLTGLVLMPVVIVNLPEDHFTRKKGAVRRRPPVLHILISVFRNLFSIILIPVGVLLLALPGPGWLTILAGIALLEFPFKKKLEIWVLSRSVVRKAVNSLREKYHRPPLQFPKAAVHAPRRKNTDKKNETPPP